MLLALFLLLTAVYAPALRGGFVWDDDGHVTMESLRSVEGLRRIWTEVGATQQYYPVLHSAFWLQHALWGDATLGYHVVNVGLHALATWLFWLLLLRMRIPGASWAALIFAVHPVHAESVAWITEQKNTLSAVFYLSAALAYLRFEQRRTRSAYAITAGWFLLALLTKTITATLPAALLVLVWWRHGRIEWRRDVLPLVPFFIVGAAAGLLTAWVERKLIGAEGVEYELTLLQRTLLAGRVIWFYLGKLAWPAELSFIYPRWNIAVTQLFQWLPLAATLTALAVLWRYRVRCRAPLAAALLFGGTLLPVLGFLNVYPFRFSFVADHFQYLASLPVIALAGVGIARLVGRRSALCAGLAAGLVGSLALSAAHQAARFRDDITLWRATVIRNPEGPMPWLNLGAALIRASRFEEAKAPLARAAQLKPDYPEVLMNQGIVEMFQGNFEAAVPLFNRALQARPQNADLHDNLGIALRKIGRADDAIAHHRQALALKPHFVGAQNNLGCALTDAGRPAEALPCFETALRVRPQDPELLHNLANALRMLGRLSDAITRYEQALRLDPQLAETHDDLGTALLAVGRVDDAIAHHRKVVELKPDWPAGHVNLGRALAHAGRMAEALAVFDRAAQLAPASADVALNRGIALAGLDRWPEARTAFGRAVQLQPNSAEARLNFGMALANTNELPAAAGQLEAAAALQPDNPDVHAALSRVLQLLGRSAEAERHRARAAALSGARP